MPRRPLQRETKLCILHAVLKRGNGWGKKHGLHSHSSSSRKTPQQLLQWWPREQRGRASLHKEKAQAQLLQAPGFERGDLRLFFEIPKPEASRSKCLRSVSHFERQVFNKTLTDCLHSCCR